MTGDYIAKQFPAIGDNAALNALAHIPPVIGVIAFLLAFWWVRKKIRKATTSAKRAFSDIRGVFDGAANEVG